MIACKTLVCCIATFAILAQAHSSKVDNGVSSSRIKMQKIELPLTANSHTDSVPVTLHEPARYSGYFKLNRTYDAHMFFFYFEARENPDTAPVTLWHTGGPGCSSELAVFYENGPWSINDDLSLSETKYGWDRASHMIYVDQPIGTGFSWSEDDRDRCYDENCVADDMLDFLQAFFSVKSELQGRDFYVTGESYAGHYVPAVASRVFQASKDGVAYPPINLKGFAIGNGLTYPAIQYGAYADFAAMHGLISNETRDGINEVGRR